MANYDNLRYQTDIYSPLVQKQLAQAIASGDMSLSDVIDVVIDVDSDRRKIQWGLWRRYNGKPASRKAWIDARYADGVPVYAREPDDETKKVDLRSHTPFDNSIVQNKKSYMTGKEPEYTDGSEDLEAWTAAVNFKTMLSEIAQDSAMMGEAFALLYTPQGGSDVFISKQQPYHCVIIYNQDTLAPLYGLIYYEDLSANVTRQSSSVTDRTIYAYWYDATTVSEFRGMQGQLQLISTEDHGMPAMPLVEFANNSERTAEAEKVIQLMDLYDILDSDFTSELSQLRLAYMLLKNMGLAFEEMANSFSTEGQAAAVANQVTKTLLEQMKKTGVFLTDNENASMEFIQKNINHEAVEYQKRDLKERIFQMSNSYDPVSLQNSGGDVTAYQIRMGMFLLEQSAAETEQHFAKALYYIAMLLSDFYNINMDELNIEFKRNVPSNIMQDIKDAREAGAQLAQKTIISKLPFPVDYEENRKALEDEQNSILVDPQ